MIRFHAGMGLLLLLGAALLGRAASAGAGGLIERDLVELGRRLFADPAASTTGHTACIDCHRPEFGFSDPEPLSRDDATLTPRRSQPLADLRAPFHWDGAFANLEQLIAVRMSASARQETDTASPHLPSDYRDWQKATRRRRAAPVDTVALLRERFPDVERQLGPSFVPAVEPFEHGLAGQRLLDAGRYQEVFERAGTRTSAEVETLARKAVQAYVAGLVSARAPIDRVAAGEPLVLGAAAERGLTLFRTRAGCVRCHPLECDDCGRAPLRDGKFHNTGVALRSFDARLRREEQRLEAEVARLAGRLLPEQVAQAPATRELADVRASLRSKADTPTVRLDDGAGDRAFKTPSLRDVARRAPYMHDGSLATLEEVVRHYAEGCGDDPQLERRLRRFDASEQDVQDLVAFLEALSTPERPGLPEHPWLDRGSGVRIRIVDATGRPLAHTEVLVEEAGDLAFRGARAGPARRLTTDEEGWIATPVGGRTHLRVVLGAGLRPEGGDLVPDVCSETTLRFPVQGRTRVALTWVDDDPPSQLEVWRPAAPGRVPRSKGSKASRSAAPLEPVEAQPWRLRRVAVERRMPIGAPPGEELQVVAVYEGYRPVERAEGFVRFPGEARPRRLELPASTTTGG